MVLRDRARLVFGSLGLGVALWGFTLFFGQLYHAIESGHLDSMPVRIVLDDPLVRRAVSPGMGAWVEQLPILGELQWFFAWFLDQVPLSLFLVLVGGLIAWRSLGWEAKASRRD